MFKTIMREKPDCREPIAGHEVPPVTGRRDHDEEETSQYVVVAVKTIINPVVKSWLKVSIRIHIALP